MRLSIITPGSIARPRDAEVEDDRLQSSDFANTRAPSPKRSAATMLATQQRTLLSSPGRFDISSGARNQRRVTR
eukprot:CAMPEP_0175751496 /NCGR_PEP_ID=MMETSP0097-20121207/61251_1 /TAXON_ID=311494 /ORGANISM="Alexandrium monilatum, Strain CCMP3105" /LENGTH=73 /DNA_ID=CAMNT_0017060195 /DNA_START=222 /DNA_END=440 /DNA_ORIENTATION=-